MRPAIVIGRIFGIPIGVHSSWFLIFALVTWSLAVGYLPFGYPGWATGVYWGVALVTSLLFFASVLLHELAHALVARSRNVSVSGITLFIFGGVAMISGEPPSAGAEFWIAVVGPVTSFALSLMFGLIGSATPSPYLSGGALYLARINFMLAAFNLLPGFPLDGGRILRAILWKYQGSFRKATHWAAVAGKTVAYLLILIGVAEIFLGSTLNGVWVAFIGWFLSNAAESSRHQLVLREMLAGVKARDIMNRDCDVIPADTHVDELVRDRVLAGGRRCFLVGHNGAVDGLITLHNIKDAPRERWPELTAAQVMTPVDRLQAARADEDVLHVLERMQEADVNQMPVMEDGHLDGMITRENLLRYIRLRSELAA